MVLWTMAFYAYWIPGNASRSKASGQRLIDGDRQTRCWCREDQSGSVVYLELIGRMTSRLISCYRRERLADLFQSPSVLAKV